MNSPANRPEKKEQWVQLSTALIRSPHLTPNEWRVYCILLTFSGCDKIFPSYKTLAKKSCLTERTILTIVKRLKEIKLLKTKKQTAANNRNTTILFRLEDYVAWAKLNKIEIPDLKLDIDEKANVKYIPGGYITSECRFLFSEDLTSIELRVFCDLLTYRYKGVVSPTSSILERDCNVSNKTLFSTLTLLENKSLIKREDNIDIDGEGIMSNKYTIYNPINWISREAKKLN